MEDLSFLLGCRDCAHFHGCGLENMRNHANNLLNGTGDCFVSREFDRDTALAVLKDLSRDMHTRYDLFGNKILCIRTDQFEAIRKKYLDWEE